jgi:hypothetical protein
MNTINYSIESFRKDIYDAVNNSQLPIGTIYFVVKDIFNEITGAYQNAVMQEAQAMAEEASVENNNIEDIETVEE